MIARGFCQRLDCMKPCGRHWLCDLHRVERFLPLGYCMDCPIPERCEECQARWDRLTHREPMVRGTS